MPLSGGYVLTSDLSPVIWPAPKLPSPGIFIGVSLYKIIMTAYTLAGAAGRKAYQIRFSGDKLCVVEIRENDQTLILEGGVNLQSASAADSIENTITQVAVYNTDNQIVKTVKKTRDCSHLYGVIQNHLRQSDGEDAGAEAQKLLDDNGLSQTITVENLGNIACITGNTVVVQEPYTGLLRAFLDHFGQPRLEGRPVL